MVAGSGVAHITQMTYFLYSRWLFLGNELRPNGFLRSSGAGG
jgi:hypothetical protein